MSYAQVAVTSIFKTLSGRTISVFFLINLGMTSKDQAVAAESWVEQVGILDTVLSFYLILASPSLMSPKKLFAGSKSE